jgi:hypothetical protein
VGDDDRVKAAPYAVPEPPAWVTVTEAAFLQGVDPWTMEDRARSGAIRAKRLGRGSGIMLVRTVDVVGPAAAEPVVQPSPEPATAQASDSWSFQAPPTGRPRRHRLPRPIRRIVTATVALVLIFLAQRFLG